MTKSEFEFIANDIISLTEELNDLIAKAENSGLRVEVDKYRHTKGRKLYVRVSHTWEAES